MTVLLDQTSLDTPSRFAPPGRYVRELALGLSELPREELGPLRLLALTRLGLDGSYEVTDDITSFQGSLDLPSPTSKDHYRWAYARRVGLCRAVRSIGPAPSTRGSQRDAALRGPDALQEDRHLPRHDSGALPVAVFRDQRRRAVIGLAIEKRRYRTADLVIAISEATRHDACAFLGVSPERVVRIYNGVDVDRWAEPTLDARGVLGGSASRHGVLLYVGASDWHKNIDGMLAGLARHARRRPTSSSRGPVSSARIGRSWILATAGTLGAGDPVRLLGT